MKFLSLFAGIGGFDLGLERAGMECVGQVELNKFCQAVLAKHWPHVKRIGDIRDVKGDEFGPVQLICGGFPCQPFSTAGKRKGEADNRFLWPEMVRVIAAIRPAWIIGENVAGIINMALDKVHSDLESIGYTVQSFIIPACALNAPHRRDRVWIVANRNSSSRSPESWQQQEERAALVDPGCSGNVADSSGERLQRCEQRGASCESAGASRPTSEFCEDVSDPSGLRWGEGNQNTGRSGAGARAQEERIRLADNSGWSVEPDVGRTLDGFSRWMDRFDLRISHKLYLTYAKETNQRPGEVLRTLRNSILSEDVQWSPGRQKCFSAKEVLLTYMCKLKAQATDKAWLQLESAEALEGAVRSLSLQNESSGASFRPTAKQQSAGEHSDALQTLSRLLAYNGKKAFVAYRRTYADSLHAWFDGWESGIERVADGIPGRVDRLRSLGNAVVPQVVEAIGRAIMQAEEGASCAQERPGERFGSAIYRQPTGQGMPAGVA